MTEKGRVPQCLSSCVLKEAGLVGEHELLWCLYLSPPPSFSLQVSLFFSAYWLWCPIVRSLSLSLSLPLAHTLSLSLSLMHAFFHTQPFDSRWAESRRSSKAGEQVPAVEHLGSSLCLQLRSLSSFPPLFLSLCRGHTHTHTLGFNLKCTCSTMITFSNCLSFNYLQLSVFNPDFFFLTSNEMEADLARTTSWWTHILRKLKTIAGWQGQ